MRECVICALCVSDSVVIIGRGMPKEKRIELILIVLFPIINPSSHSALISAQYTLISVVSDTTHDNDTMIVSVLRDSVVSYRFTHSIIE